MKFVCNRCTDDPCTLIVDDDIFWDPRICPFEESIIDAKWEPEGAKNTEQANQPDSGE